MKKRIVDLRGLPLLDIVSLGRRGRGYGRPLTPAEIAHVTRTARRVPEVMVKVSGGARSLRGVAQHLDYIGREGEKTVEGDDGVLHQHKHFEKALLKDWDLDMDGHRRYTERGIAIGRKPPKLVHNLVFSMPKGTPPDKLHAAVRRFAMETFALQHRYAMVLHTDQGHPHVHVVVKALSEQGERLYIRKATLREWRRDFAQYLRDFGVEANATARAVRGQSRQSKPDGIYRAMQRGESTHMRERAESVAHELAVGGLAPEKGFQRMRATRRDIVQAWEAIAKNLERQGQPDLASLVQRFMCTMPPLKSERHWIAEQLAAGVRDKRLDRNPPIR